MEIFETGSTLFSTLGFPLFDPLATATEAENPAELFFCRSPGAGVDGKGLYTPEGFVVLAGSVGRLENVPSIQGTNDARVRECLITSSVAPAVRHRPCLAVPPTAGGNGRTPRAAP